MFGFNSDNKFCLWEAVSINDKEREDAVQGVGWLNTVWEHWNKDCREEDPDHVEVMYPDVSF